MNFQVPQNDNNNALHGGPVGFDRHVGRRRRSRVASHSRWSVRMETRDFLGC